MEGLLWAALGMAFGAAVLHFALGLRRPIDRTYLAFAVLMGCLAAYLYYERAYYHADSVDEGVAAMRGQLVAAHGFIACSLVFVPAYTGVRMPRWMAAIAWGGLATLFAANLALPYGIWFSGRPELVRATFAGEPYHTLVAPPLAWPQYAHSVYVLALFALALASAVSIARRGDRSRGKVLAVSFGMVIIAHIVDLVRDVSGGTWPYVAEFGVAAWGLIMSVRLASEYKRMQRLLAATLVEVEQRTAELAKLVDAALHVRDRLNTPLQTLELGLTLRTPKSPRETPALDAMRAAVVELAQLGRAVERTAQVPPTDGDRGP
jgi:hypothetical protein